MKVKPFSLSAHWFFSLLMATLITAQQKRCYPHFTGETVIPYLGLNSLPVYFKSVLLKKRCLCSPRCLFPQLWSSGPQWSDLLMSQHFSRTDLPRDGVEYSTFTCHPATRVCPSSSGLDITPLQDLLSLTETIVFNSVQWGPDLHIWAHNASSLNGAIYTCTEPSGLSLQNFYFFKKKIALQEELVQYSLATLIYLANGKAPDMSNLE